MIHKKIVLLARPSERKSVILSPIALSLKIIVSFSSSSLTFHWSMASIFGTGVLRTASTASRSRGIWNLGEMVTGTPSRYEQHRESKAESIDVAPPPRSTGREKDIVLVLVTGRGQIVHVKWQNERAANS
jgi:hypothetical protein